jgi:hypothetical protein
LVSRAYVPFAIHEMNQARPRPGSYGGQRASDFARSTRLKREQLDEPHLRD